MEENAKRDTPPFETKVESECLFTCL